MELERPLPQPITPEAKPYWDGLREQKLMLPRCRACQRAFLYPRVLCPFCHASDIEWVQASGRGKLYSFEIAYQTISKAFKVKPPYVLAMIELEEGPRMMSNLVGIEPDPEAHHVRHARRGRLREAHRRDHAAAVQARGRRPMKELAELGLHRRRRRERRAGHAAAQEHAHAAPRGGAQRRARRRPQDQRRRRRLHRRASTRPRRSARRSASCRATSTAPRWAAARSSSWSATRWLALHHGLCDVAVVSHGESGRSGVGVTPRRDTALPGQYETPYGFGGAPTYFGMITTRHMHEYGTTLEQWAQVAVSTRAWAALNPKARNREPITVEDVLNSRPVCYPFNLLNICLVTDAGGAVVLTRADRAKDCAKKPVYVRGAGEATEHVMLTQMKNLTQSEATRLSGAQGVRDGRREPQGLRPHHALRRLHLGAADHARVARLLQARRGRALLRERQVHPGRHAAHQHQRRRPVVHPLRACTASSRSSRRCASSAASAARARCRTPSSRS